MKVFIEKSEDGLFLKTDFVWVSLKEEAKAFSNCTPAINYCVEHGIRNVKLRLSFGDARYDLPVEIFPRKAKACSGRGRGMTCHRPKASAACGSRRKIS